MVGIRRSRVYVITRTMRGRVGVAGLSAILSGEVVEADGGQCGRTSHNPPTPEWLDACDSLGLLVLDENRLLNSGPEYLDQFRRLIFRDRSRASVFMWSLGNEEGYIQTRPVGREIALTLMGQLKEWDPTRTCTYAADVANVYQGINEVIPVRGFNYRIKGVEPYHEDHPGQPIIGTEMGSTVTTRGIYEKDTVRGYVPDEDVTAPWWANTAEQWWPMAAERRGRWAGLCGRGLIIGVNLLPIIGRISAVISG